MVGNHKIVVIDDEQMVRDAMGFMLRYAGHQVATTADANSGSIQAWIISRTTRTMSIKRVFFVAFAAPGPLVVQVPAATAIPARTTRSRSRAALRSQGGGFTRRGAPAPRHIRA